MPPLYILRHGQTVWNVAGRQQGRRDSALTPLGRIQAARQGAILRAAGITVASRCSPLGRARTSAALAGLDVSIDARLAEIGMGAWEGTLAPSGATAAGIRWKFDAPGGEGLTSVQDRIEALLSDISGPTVLVTHGVIAVLLRARLLRLGPEEWDRLDDPQGVIHRIENGCETLLR
jgi:broad specificity phosphatase PhoE